MGWLFQYEVQDVEDYIERFTTDDPSLRCLGYYYHEISGTSGVLYIANEVIHRETGYAVSRHISVFLLERDAKLGCWGYKAMDCCMGPIVDTCPDILLKFSPPHIHSEYCSNFHNRCKAESIRVPHPPLGFNADGRLVPVEFRKQA